MMVVTMEAFNLGTKRLGGGQAFGRSDQLTWASFYATTTSLDAYESSRQDEICQAILH